MEERVIAEEADIAEVDHSSSRWEVDGEEVPVEVPQAGDSGASVEAVSVAVDPAVAGNEIVFIYFKQPLFCSAQFLKTALFQIE